jgi:hypothetical protein
MVGVGLVPTRSLMQARGQGQALPLHAFIWSLPNDNRNNKLESSQCGFCDAGEKMVELFAPVG